MNNASARSKKVLEKQRLAGEVSRLAKSRVEALLKGVGVYQAASYRRDLPEAPAVWRRGTARLLDYSAAARADNGTAARPCPPVPILFIPSLINRYYVLDLQPKRSLLRFLAQAGAMPLVIDWDAPGPLERGYACADYVTDHLAAALRFVRETTGQPPVLAGYCMGGILALALAALFPHQARGLALFATPWDFHSADMRAPRLNPAALARARQWLSEMDSLPAAQVQALFSLMDPWLFQEKFQRLSTLTPGSAAFESFMALERWVNDGVPLAKRVAEDCLIRFGQENLLARGQWKVDGQRIIPQRIRMPVFVAAPRKDNVVPPGCALPLHRLLPHSALCEPSGGHVGMIVGRKARAELWQPFARWLSLQRSI
ncbi:MAG: alpha/beta fold hydrolase [Alphaproteobacteria bacterium]|nr:alpha/beta fold hydrolase [Alphaproteobacteria bacterium]